MPVPLTLTVLRLQVTPEDGFGLTFVIDPSAAADIVFSVSNIAKMANDLRAIMAFSQPAKSESRWKSIS